MRCAADYQLGGVHKARAQRALNRATIFVQTLQEAIADATAP